MGKNLFMIMCHKNLEQVLRLAKHITKNPDSDVVVHVDISVPDDEFQSFCSLANDIPNLYITEKRIKGMLDDRSLIDIVFIMIEYVRAKNLQYQYYALLSGQDFLIKPIDQINQWLSESYPKPFIDCTPYDKSNWIYKKFVSDEQSKIEKFQESVFRFTRRWGRRHPARKILRFLIRPLSLFNKPKMPIYKKLSRRRVSLFGGSAWWILPDVAINYILEEYQKSTAIVKLLLSPKTPEEIFFQTMTMRSPIKDSVEINPIDQVAQNCKTWAYFTDIDKPFVCHPYVFTVKQFERLKKSDCWFARKFDSKTDDEVIRMVEENLLK